MVRFQNHADRHGWWNARVAISYQHTRVGLCRAPLPPDPITRAKRAKVFQPKKTAEGRGDRCQDRWRRPAESSEEAKEADPSPVQPEPAFNRLAIKQQNKGEAAKSSIRRKAQISLRHINCVEDLGPRWPASLQMCPVWGSTAAGDGVRVHMFSSSLRPCEIMRLNESNNLGWILCRVWANLITVTSAEAAFSCQP